MRVVIAGGHGNIALRLGKLLSARGDAPVGLIRNPDQADALRAAGVEPVTCDLEQADPDEVAAAVRGADAAVFAAGAGPGSGAARKQTMDQDGAARFAAAAEQEGVRRHLLVSAMGLDRAERSGRDDVFTVYLRAKAASEQDVTRRDLDWTILRPGRLTDDPGAGEVRLASTLPRGSVSRQDVAATLLALLDEPRTARLTLELIAGDTPVAEAVAQVAAH
ncbi:MAG: NAD(P)H-binding protein [Micromonosporaceae bacterium]